MKPEDLETRSGIMEGAIMEGAIGDAIETETDRRRTDSLTMTPKSSVVNFEAPPEIRPSQRGTDRAQLPAAFRTGDDYQSRTNPMQRSLTGKRNALRE
jgi:hypothetical protein